MSSARRLTTNAGRLYALQQQGAAAAAAEEAARKKAIEDAEAAKKAAEVEAARKAAEDAKRAAEEQEEGDAQTDDGGPDKELTLIAQFKSRSSSSRGPTTPSSSSSGRRPHSKDPGSRTAKTPLSSFSAQAVPDRGWNGPIDWAGVDVDVLKELGWEQDDKANFWAFCHAAGDSNIPATL
jgi:hypothetical protein